MKPENNIEQKLEQLADAIGSSDSFVSDVMNRIENSSSQPSKKQERNIVLRKILMKKSIKLTVAASILIAVFLSLTLLDNTVAPAYALEQTIEALNAMRSIHTRIYYPINTEPALLWVEFHENGLAKRLRVSQPAFDPHDGPKEVVWKNGNAQVWSKKTNTLYYLREKEVAEKIGKLFHNLDPKLLIKKLEAMEQNGTAQLVIEQPDDISKPIVITATLTEEDTYFGHQTIALVDQATKLVISIETLKGDGTLAHKNGHFGMDDFNLVEFFDYNQSFEETIFTLKVPDDAIILDQATRKVGLFRGDMSVEETAVEVVEKFFDSIIDHDYETAGLMYGGLTSDIIEKHFGKKSDDEILRVISIGKAKVHPNPMYKKKAFIVNCTIEYKKQGQIMQKSLGCVVKEVDGQPGRWAICGGI
jgi:hypothetical protein